MKQQRHSLSKVLFCSTTYAAEKWGCLPQKVIEYKDHQSLCQILEVCRLYSTPKTAIETHARIIRFGYEVFPAIFASLVSTYEHCRLPNHARQLCDQIFSWELDLISMNIVIKSFMRIGDCKFARKVFYKMSVRDVVTWNSIIGGYVKNGKYEDALRIFGEMLSSGIEPDGFTFTSVITACARIGALDKAQWIHQLMVEKKIALNSILTAALIGMYSKCGRIDTARGVFDSSDSKDISVWNTMLNGLAIHGLPYEAIAIFSKMKSDNVQPDFITFLAILTACSHCGLVQEGYKYFDMMRNQYSMQPQLEHYGAMVDLLGRAGLLEEAYNVVKAMPMKPDGVIWRSLLSACRIYKNQKLARAAISSVCHLESGDYVLLSNIYSSLERWDAAESARETMKRKGIHKSRGKSWVEVAGGIHVFKVGEGWHPERDAVYKGLEWLVKLTKTRGYVPLTDLVFMDVCEEEKEGNLCHHSEKLALVYGILKTGPGTEIRISKNLRICYDCHCWIKLVSDALNRVVIVRDRIRFHRFEGGLCSCGDYW